MKEGGRGKERVDGNRGGCGERGREGGPVSVWRVCEGGMSRVGGGWNLFVEGVRGW